MGLLPKWDDFRTFRLVSEEIRTPPGNSTGSSASHYTTPTIADRAYQIFRKISMLCTPGRARTRNLKVRNLPLYPVELRGYQQSIILKKTQLVNSSSGGTGMVFLNGSGYSLVLAALNFSSSSCHICKSSLWDPSRSKKIPSRT